MTTPKAGTIERIVLDALIAAGPAGLNYLEFPPELGLTPDSLDAVIVRLRNGIYEAESDEDIKLDS